jgi:hypothetical protein
VLREIEPRRGSRTGKRGPARHVCPPPPENLLLLARAIAICITQEKFRKWALWCNPRPFRRLELNSALPGQMVRRPIFRSRPCGERVRALLAAANRTFSGARSGRKSTIRRRVLMSQPGRRSAAMACNHAGQTDTTPASTASPICGDLVRSSSLEQTCSSKSEGLLDLMAGVLLPKQRQ